MKSVPWVIIAILLLVIIYLRECTPKPECPPSILRVDTLPGDTVIHDTTIYRPTMVYRDTGSIRWLNQDIDTAAILAACRAVNHYRDTLLNDTSALVVVENEVSMNELRRTSLSFFNRRDAITTICQIPSLSCKTWFYGISGGGRLGRLSLGPFISYSTKVKMYSIGYDAINQNVSISLGFAIK